MSASFSIELSQGLRTLVADLGKMDPALRADIRKRFRAIGKSVLDDARQRASWSSRIPGATTLRTSTSASTAGITLRVSSAKAPHARPYEGIGGSRGGTFRHPVFGNRDVWVAQQQRPFWVPAAQAHRTEVTEAAVEAVKTAARAARFA